MPFVILGLSLPGCSSLLTPDDPAPDDAVVFEPATLAIQVGRTETLALNVPAGTIDEVELRWGAGPGDVRVELTCEPTNACQVTRSSRQGQAEVVQIGTRGVHRVAMRVTGLAPGRETVRASLSGAGHCDFSFLGGCRPPVMLQGYAPIEVGE